jgi:hypothetical protein
MVLLVSTKYTLKSINKLVYRMWTDCVLCEVGTQLIYNLDKNQSLNYRECLWDETLCEITRYFNKAILYTHKKKPMLILNMNDIF